MLPLTERDKQVLKILINDYISTGEPVGSRTVAKKSDLNLSPATIRNVMADLEEMGFLFQPHTSAGRIPTEKGLRFFADALLDLQGLSVPEREEIRNTCQDCKTDISTLMRKTCWILSAFSNYTGIVMAPPLQKTIFKHIEFIRLRRTQILVIFVASSGLVQNRVVGLEEDLSQGELDKITHYLNDLLTGLPLGEVRERIVEEMRREKRTYDELLQKALQLGGKVLITREERDLYIEGQVNILDEPSFADVERMKELFKAFEEKSLLVKLLDRSMKARGVQILFGSECQIAGIEGCSLITSTYGHPGRFLGILGVIGPMRMNYSRVIPVVDFTAKLLTEILESEWSSPL
ncbi:MAG: heat-inducible transcription repressor HrcA [Deltaproteobacteria bacterium]|nr:MAG: heat-inducible transcription repressor HrcA [Deltaproteobacteria bacterium]